MLQDGESALYLAAWNGDVEAVKLLLKHDAAVDIRSKVTNYPVNLWVEFWVWLHHQPCQSRCLQNKS